jgi:ankyrin repeat protein
MKSLPSSPDLSHLKKQAKQLLQDALAGDAQALAYFGTASKLKLHAAQFVVAREYGFRSWSELKHFVEWKQMDRAERLKVWFEWNYDGNRRQRGLALRTLREEADFAGGNVWMACACGDKLVLQKKLAGDQAWVNGGVGPMGMTPLIAVTHSMLILEAKFEERLLDAARLLLQHGADPNVSWTNPKFPDWPLSALYGAAGKTHHAGMLKLLLEAGANPDDNESLYHSVESPDSTCTRVLLAAGARVSRTNAMARALDYGKLDDLRLMLQRGGDVREQPLIHHAILRGRSLEQIMVLVDAGADLQAVNKDGISLYRWAQMHGRTDVVECLLERGIDEPLTLEEQFLAACARGDDAAARAIQEQAPDIYSRLTAKQLGALPEQADTGNMQAVRTMLELGWPREAKAAWRATALNLATMRGDPGMADLLLRYGADWRTPHGFGDNVLGTLSWASQNDVEDPSAPRDYVGCAKALVAHSVPVPDGKYSFSEAVAEYFESVRT